MRRASALALVLAAGAMSGGAASAAAPARASLPAIEREVMCVTCKIPLELAQSPQADRERAFIAALIGRGYDEAQIKRALVAQYGTSVLALPSAHGFDLAVYVVPLAALLAVIALLAVLLPRWRRAGAARADGDSRGAHAPPPMSPEDADRVAADLSRFD
jgi:cytochrome c-type biogenesis protein CcmH/NrfF